MNTKHTPAPWGIAENHMNEFKNQYTILSLMTHTVCEVTRHNYKEVGNDKFKDPETLHKDEEALANAKLIAAAPELLEALQMLSEWNDKYPPNKVYSYDRAKVIETALTEIVEKAKDAIKKATL